MNDVTINQAYLFLIFILNGMFIGILFDIFRILRRSFETPNFVTSIEDAIFWIGAMASVLYTLFVFNNGEIRGYIFIGLFLGIALYMLILSKFIVKISVIIITFFKDTLYKIFKIIIYPIKIIYKMMKKVFAKPIKSVFKCLDNVENSMKKKIKLKKYKKLKNKEGI